MFYTIDIWFLSIKNSNYYCVCARVHTHMYVHHGAHVEIRGQPCGVDSSLLPFCGFWKLNSGLIWYSKSFTRSMTFKTQNIFFFFLRIKRIRTQKNHSEGVSRHLGVGVTDARLKWEPMVVSQHKSSLFQSRHWIITAAPQDFLATSLSSTKKRLRSMLWNICWII